jgi:hypothetical protein
MLTMKVFGDICQKWEFSLMTGNEWYGFVFILYAKEGIKSKNLAPPLG